MKVYLAARYSRYLEMQEVARDLEAVGYTITSRWIRGNHEVSDPKDAGRSEEYQRYAFEDLSDVLDADWSIHFTEVEPVGRNRGGRHVEFGMALTRHSKIFIVGPRENVFHWLRDVYGTSVHVFPDWSTAKEVIGQISIK